MEVLALKWTLAVYNMLGGTAAAPTPAVKKSVASLCRRTCRLPTPDGRVGFGDAADAMIIKCHQILVKFHQIMSFD
jgi:hypothetical protein